LKILVTGGAGFIGSHVADAYIAGGHSVSIIDNLVTGKKENVSSRARFMEMDIRSQDLGNLMREEKFDVVNHHAAQMDVRKSVDDPLYDAAINISGTLNILEHARRTGVNKVIFSSTGGAIYGEQDYFPADELHPTRPVSPYGVSKLTVEHYLHYYKVIHQLHSVVLRYANVYGPRQNPHGEAGVVAIFVRKMLVGEEPVINGDGRQTRDYVFVGDVVQANLRALACDSSDVFNIGTGIETDVNALFSSIRTLTKSSSGEHHGSAKPGEQRRSVLECSKAKRVLGWQPTVQVSDGLKLTVEFFQSQMNR
jgi:UDP-glucose 4-epimerase